MQTQTNNLSSPGISHDATRTTLVLENIKCGGCGKTIEKNLQELGLKNIIVDPNTQTVVIDNPASPAQLQNALSRLKSLGYPLVDTEEGLKALALKAKSYLSCAIGKMS